MLNFTVGPVMSHDEVLEIGKFSSPYFRTPEFSSLMMQNEKIMLKLLNAPEGSRCVFLTSSGTGAMESCVMNVLNDDDKVLVINGGSFGQRFADLCTLHKRNATEIKVGFGKQLKREALEVYTGKGYTVLLVNMHETSSGLLYDMEMISDFCKKNNLLLIVDAISAFIADEIDMEELGAAVVITGSQKALAVPPGISIVALATQALERVKNNREVCMYLSLKEALKNGERGQTPFTPAVTTLLQINARLLSIAARGSVAEERAVIVATAEDFRRKIKDLPFDFVAESMSNAVTAIHPLASNATQIVKILKDEYNIWVCPNGGDKCDEVFRVGHIGNIGKEDNECLIDALHDMHKRGLLDK